MTQNVAAERAAQIFDRSNNSRIDLSIQSSTMSGNTATSGSGGGVYSRATYGSQLSVQNSMISGNTSLSKGGGVYANERNVSSLEIQNSTISGNTSSSDSGGGRVFDCTRNYR